MTINTNDLTNFVQYIEQQLPEEDMRVLRELLWLAYCRLCYTHSDRVTEMKALLHEWARLETQLGVE